MGWKAVKDHYRVIHQVQVVEGAIHIGSSYISDIMVISPQGALTKHYDRGSNQDLNRYQDEMLADPPLLASLVAMPDQFECSIAVFTFDGANIIEKLCEQPGWPNVTHDGCMMYENTYSTDREQVIGWAKRSSLQAIEYTRKQLARLQEEVHACEAELAKHEATAADLVAQYPKVAQT